MDMQVSLWHVDLEFCFLFRYTRSDLVGVCGSSIFSILKNHRANFHSSPPVLLTPCSHWDLLLRILLVVVILARVRWNLPVLLICIVLIAKNIEHHFGYIYSLEEYLFSAFAHLLIG